MSTNDLSLLLDHLQYWPEAHQFTWKKSPGRRIKVNGPAGHRTVSGKLVIHFQGKRYNVQDLIDNLTPSHCKPIHPSLYTHAL
jgi:hypothetical protein